MQHVLIIGAGTMGSVHTAAYQKMANVEIAGVVDLQKEKGIALGLEENRVFNTLDEAVNMVEKIDVIDICLPTVFHKEYVKKAADLGINIICEKPLARTLEDATEMNDYCIKKNVRLFVGHVVRFFPEYQRAKQLLEKGEIGKVGVVRTRRGGIFPTAWKDWYGDFEKSGGLILDMIIHDFDFIRWCFGDVERIFAKGFYNREYGRKDYSLITLRMKSGVIAHVEGSWSHQGFSSAFEISGNKGIIDFDSADQQPLNAVIHKKDNEVTGVAVPENPLEESPYFRELQHFIHCIESGEEALVTPSDAIAAMEIAIGALKSIQANEPVTLNEYVGRQYV